MTKDAPITPNSKGWEPCTRAGKKTKYLSPVSHNMTVGDIDNEGGYACLRVGDNIENLCTFPSTLLSVLSC